MEDIEKNIEKYSPYLNDLFRRINIVTLWFVGSFVTGVLFSAPILKQSIHFFTFKDVALNTTSPFQLFDVAMDIGFFLAVLVCIPVLIYQSYAFIKTALHKNEKRMFFMMIPLGFFLFLIGFIYGFLIMYSTIQLLANVNTSLGIQNMWDISLFLSRMISTSALLGLLFEFPIVISVLIKTKIVDLQFMKDKRRHAILIMFVLTSLLPPTDGVSLILMVLPLIVMYECTIIYNRLSK